jgi:2-haloacid dehalogenase
VISGLILAAGTSSRLGRPKQLLELGGRPLLQLVIDAAAGAGLDEVVVVLGHEAARVEAALEFPPAARVLVNADYLEGQSTSLRAGLDALSEASDAAVILLGDQPGVSSSMIRRAVTTFHSSGGPVVRARFADVPGHPVVVARSQWDRWRNLSGDAGARLLMESHSERVVELELGPEALADVDTWADYEDLTRGESAASDTASDTREPAASDTRESIASDARESVASDARTTIAFDILGTLFSLESLRPGLTARGAPPQALELWFAESLRDYFAASHAGAYLPLKDVLRAALPRTLDSLGATADSDQIDRIMQRLPELDLVPGAESALGALREQGCKLLALTNGSEEVTRALLEGAGILDWFQALLSCDSIGVSKPHPDVYAMARAEAAGELWMVAAHAWDVAGAKKAGLATAWIAGKEGRYLDVYPAPDVTAPDVESAAEQILDRMSAEGTAKR